MRLKEKPESMDPAADALVTAGKNIHGLDIATGLECLEWNLGAWLEMTRSFSATTPRLLEILKIQNPENLPKYTVTVHGIKSVCYSLGAMEAGKKAEELEDRSRAGDLVYIRENTGEFISLIETLIADLLELLGKTGEKPGKPLKKRPDEGILAKIRLAAEDYDMGNMEEGISALEEWSYEEENELVPWLREQSGHSDFAAIAERLAKPEN